MRPCSRVPGHSAKSYVPIGCATVCSPRCMDSPFANDPSETGIGAPRKEAWHRAVNSPVMDTAPLVDTRASRFATLRPLGLKEVELRDRFWEPRRKTNRESTLFEQLRLCEETNRLRNFDRAAGKTDAAHAGPYYNDSDVYKWLEAASWSLAADPDRELADRVDEVVHRVAAAQRPDGYLNTYYARDRADDRWTNLRDMHEIYCAGHLIQAGVAHHRATGKAILIDVAIRFAEHMLDRFGDNPPLTPGACGHPEAEMALVELGRTTGDSRYRELARHMVSVRGRQPALLGGGEYWQDHAPVSRQRTPMGHAVRQLYLAAGVADLTLESNLPEWLQANKDLWDNFVRRRMYATGGAGSRWDGEAFGDDFELPNDRAYAETCAAIANVQWNHRLWLRDGDVRHADLIEWTLINAVLPGLSLDGARYFYQNPLTDRGAHRRQSWFGCACCPPNVSRTLASLPGLVAARDERSICIGQIIACRIESGDVRIDVEADLPWDSRIRVRAEGRIQSIKIRIPAWARGARRDDRPVAPGWCEMPLSGGMLDTRLEFPMGVRALRADARVGACRGQVAFHRGPVLYCAEAVDHAGDDPTTFGVGTQPAWTQRDMEIDGRRVVMLDGDGWMTNPDDSGLWTASPNPSRRNRDLHLVPYHAWANRDSGPMTVWLLDGA